MNQQGRSHSDHTSLYMGHVDARRTLTASEIGDFSTPTVEEALC